MWPFNTPVKESIDATSGLLKVADGLFTSDEERINAQTARERLLQQPMQNQHIINQIEAQHRSVFVAGWRPFIGWVCGIGLLNAFILNPYLETFFSVTIPVPIENMMTLVVSLLGLASARTIEKLNGRTK